MSAALAGPELRQRFLAGMSNAALTVNVVTTDGPAGKFGVTVSAMSSVSADTARPTLLVCVHHRSASSKAIIENGVFCVNVLRDDQAFISDCFAGRIKMPDGDKFSCAKWVRDSTGAPRVADVLVAFSCRVTSTQKVGTHHVLFGEVEEISTSGPGSPLIYANRAYGTPMRIDLRPAGEMMAGKLLKLGIFHTFGPYLVPKVLEKLLAGGHLLDLKMLEGDQRRILEGLKAGDIEMGLVYDFDLGPELVAERLDALHPYVLLAENHPLAAKPALSLAELAGEPMILLDAPPSGDYFLSLFRDKNLTPNIRMRSMTIEMVRGLVGCGLGYSILATKPAASMSYDGHALTTRPLIDETRPSHLALVTRAGAVQSEAAVAFAAACRGLFKPSD